MSLLRVKFSGLFNRPDGYGDSHLLSGRTLRRGLKRMSVLKNFCGHLVADGSGRDAYVSAQAHCTPPRRGNCERL